jgi:hypothetical protein
MRRWWAQIVISLCAVLAILSAPFAASWAVRWADAIWAVCTVLWCFMRGPVRRGE